MCRMVPDKAYSILHELLQQCERKLTLWLWPWWLWSWPA